MKHRQQYTQVAPQQGEPSQDYHDDTTGKQKPVKNQKKSKQKKVKKMFKKESSSVLAANNEKLPFTEIPVRHFKALLRQEKLCWLRNYKRSIPEIFLPCIVFIVIAFIRITMLPHFVDYKDDLSKHSSTFFSLPSMVRDERVNFTMTELYGQANNQIKEMQQFYKFMNKSEYKDQIENTFFTTWVSDNCQRTEQNEPRSKWAVIYENEDAKKMDTVTREVHTDIKKFVYFKKNFKQIAKDLADIEFQKYGDVKMFNFTNNFPLDDEALEFTSEQEFNDYLKKPNYEAWQNKTDDLPGICFAIYVQNNLWKDEYTRYGEKPIVDYRFYGEMKDGDTVSEGEYQMGDGKLSSQIVMPTSAEPSIDILKKYPESRPTEMYIRQGYSPIQNWVANSVLRAMTNEPEAQIAISITPMKFKVLIKDEFEQVMTGIYSYLQIIIYMLPMYSYISRIQQERQTGIRAHLAVLGLSQQAQMLAMFSSYCIQVTMIALFTNSVMHFMGLFPKSYANSFLLMFLYMWAQGISNFGFIVLMSAILPKNMQPKIAAKIGTLIYFGSLFADFTVQRRGVAEIKKTILAMIFPTIATARACKNVVQYEYVPGGSGINWHMLWEPYNDFRLGTYFLIQLWGLVFHLFVGLLFTKYGTVVEIWSYIKRDCFKIRSDMDLDAIKRRSKNYDLECFEDGDDQTKILEDEQEDQLLIIRNLIKRFQIQQEVVDDKIQNGEKKFFSAVDGLSLKLYKGQIFSLLGHNGAGKTTTISMLTGMIDANYGSVKCLGRQFIHTGVSRSQLKEDIAYLRQIMGICPQNDILFDFMTVQEHLDFFCDFKGVDPKLKDEKIIKIMKDVDVYAHRHTQTKSLSGGNRRKLSVALALVADSKFVVLDEPTSSLDLTARRRLWDMLKDYKKDRIIVLTTHNLDEADLLGDRVGIMKAGQIVCLGSSEFLKEKFGYGFRIKIQRNKEIQINGDFEQQITDHMLQNLGQKVNLVSSDEYGITYQIDPQYRNKFQQFFKNFDQQETQNALAIKSYSISVTSLEDVFLSVGQQNQLASDVPQQQQNILIQDEAEPEIVSKKIEKHRQNLKWHEIILNQTKALVDRKVRSYKRTLTSTLFEVTVPLILLGVGFCFTKLEFDLNIVDRVIKPETYHPFHNLQSQRIMVNSRLAFEHDYDNEEDFDDDIYSEFEQFRMIEEAFPGVVNLQPQDIISNLPGYDNNQFHVEYFDVEESMKFHDKEANKDKQNITYSHSDKYAHFHEELYQRRGWDEYENLQNIQEKVDLDDVIPYRYGSYYFFEANNATKKFKIATFVNLTSNDVVNYYSQYLYEAVIKSASGRKDLDFKVTNVPFPKSKRNRGYETDANGIFVAFCAGISFALIPASIVSRIVHEKESGLLHLQRVSGVDNVAYWLSYYVFDIIKTYLTCMGTWLLIKAFDLKYENFHLLLIIYPWAIVPYAYCTSYMFNRESTAQTFSIYLNFLMSGIASILVFACKMVASTALWGDRMMWIMRFVTPQYNLCNGIIYTATDTLISNVRNENIKEIKLQYPNQPEFWPIEIKKKDSWNLNNLGGDMLAVAILSVVWLLIFVICEFQPDGRSIFSCQAVLPPKKTDKELNLDHDVQIEHHRVQEQCQDSLVCVDSFRKVYTSMFTQPTLAVEKASFAVDKGECFALLGVNGAGKSTTFKSLTNVVQPTDGKVMVEGQMVSHHFNSVRHKLGYCPQQHSLFTSLTVREHLQFYAVIKGLPPSLHYQLISQAVNKLRIQKYINIPAEQLSGGNKRKLQVAIAILGNPQVIMLDEPSAGMDPAARQFMWGVVNSVQKTHKNCCVILTTHTMEEAEALSTKMGIMVQGGKFRCFGTPAHIKDKFGSGLEIEVRMKKMDQNEIDRLIQALELDQEMSRTVLISKIAAMQIIREDQIQDFENNLAKYLGPEELTIELFVQCLSCYLTQYNLIFSLLKIFESVEILESYGILYIKLRVPKHDKTIGYIFGLIESQGYDGIQQYSVSQTSLEMIFNFFAQGGRKPKNSKKGFDSQVFYMLKQDYKEIEVVRQERGKLSQNYMMVFKDSSYNNILC